MKLTFFGAAREVGRSCILVENKDTKLLLDAGVKLTEKQTELPIIPKELLGEIKGVVISHAHLDHCGYLPHLFSKGFSAGIYATKPTLELTNVIVADYLRISKPEEVTKAGIASMVKHYRNQEYFKPFDIGTFRVRLYPAGHILGSSIIEVEDTTTGKKLLYTGDFNMRSTRLLPPAYAQHLKADAVITESTYSGKEDVFPSEKAVINSFINGVKEALLKGSKVIIPSFAVGRAQEVLFILNDYLRSGILPKTTIYIDGMIGKAMRIYRHNVIYCRDEVQKQILMSDEDPFKSVFFHEVKGRQERRKIISQEGGAIIVTTSGMLKGGPVVNYLAALASNEQNKLIFVGYQAPGTPGRKLIEGGREIELGEKKIEIKMKVESYKLSAHSDRPSLIKFYGGIEGLKDLIIVHGEEQKMLEFAQSLKQEYKVHTPQLGSSIEI